MNTNTILSEQFSKNVREISLRYNWIDWMKTLGIIFITYGHFFSLWDIYVYVFNVPLFFFISGFLCKVETNNSLFWKKIWFNLIVPMIIICSINFLVRVACDYLSNNHSLTFNPFIFIGKMILGLHESIGVFWFIYTLVVLKIILQYTNKLYVHFLFFILFLTTAYFINNYDFELFGLHPFRWAWAIFDTFVAYPFFIIGYLTKRWKKQISNYKPNKYTHIYIIFLILIIFLCGYNHNYVFLYKCCYGDNILLYLVGGLAGTILVYLISKLLENYSWGMISKISTGTTIILGFHLHLIGIYRSIISYISIIDFVLSIIIVCLFVPIIYFCELYFPIIIGIYRVKKKNNY